MASSTSSFGSRLRSARARMSPRWTQQDLADQSGVSYATIKAWESRDDAPLGSPNLERVAHALGVTVTSLVDDAPAGGTSAPGPVSPASSRLTDQEWDTIQALLPRIPETLLVAELSRRTTLRAAREGHDQSNVEPLGVKGLRFSGDDAEVEGETGPA